MFSSSTSIKKIGIGLISILFSIQVQAAFDVPTDNIDCTLNGVTIADGSSVSLYTSATVSYGKTCDSALEVRTCVKGVLSGTAQYGSCTVLPESACSLGGMPIPGSSAITTYQNATVAYGNQCVAEQRVCSNGQLSGSFTALSCEVLPPATCDFNGQVLQHGQTVDAYLRSSVPYGFSCTSALQTRTCNNGVLTGDAEFATCEVSAAKSCEFNGSPVAHGQSVQAFVSSSVAFGKTCQAETRTCNNGTLSGSAAFASCDVGQASACLLNGKTIAHGKSVQAFVSSSVAFGKTCQVETRSCENGVLSGAATFDTCVVDQPQSCAFNGSEVKHGEFATAFQNSTVAFGQSCVSEQRKCDNGQLEGSYTFGSCAIGQPAKCQFNGETIEHNSTVIGYSSSSVSFGQSCSTVAEVRTCSNGVLSGTAAFASCEVGQPKSCLFNGLTVAHGDSVNAFASSTTQYGQSCQAEARTCNNGVLSGSAQYGSCTEGQPASCLLNGKTIAHGQVVKLYASSSVPYGQSCVQQDRTCNNGTLSGTATAESCTVQPKPEDPAPVTGDLYWEFPEKCGCGSQGKGYNMSMYSKDGGKTWSYIKDKAPEDLQAVWDYMMKKYGSNKCGRPNVKYISAWHKGYVKFDKAYLPPRCEFVEQEVKSGTSSSRHHGKGHHGHHGAKRGDEGHKHDGFSKLFNKYSKGHHSGKGSCHGKGGKTETKKELVYICKDK